MNDLARKAILWTLAVQAGFVGVWAGALPSAFYRHFPAPGHHWVQPAGPYGEHLIRDVGTLSTALAVMTAAAALAGAPEATVRGVAAGWLVYAVPHLAYHVVHRMTLPTLDQWLSLSALAIQVVLPVLLLRPRTAGWG